MPIDQYAKTRSLTTSQRVALLEQAAAGLDELHKVGLTHRDLHAGNLVVTEAGHVRLIDFGLAGTAEERHKTIAAPGNRDCTPPEVLDGTKRGDERDDVYALAALAIQVLTDAKMPENTTRSGDSKHLARCRNQLREKGVGRSLQALLLACLQKWEERTVLAGTLAEQLEDWRVRRPQRQRLWCLATVAALLLVLLSTAFAWYVGTKREELARRDVEILRAEVALLPNAGHAAVGKLVQQAAATRDAAQSKELLRRALHIGQALDGSRQRREALGVALNDTAWTQLDVITRRRDELSQLYQQALTELEGGDAEQAERSLDELQRSLAELSKDNVAAAGVLVARQQFDRVATLVPERLRAAQPQELSRINERLQDGLVAANERKWNEATDHLGQARQQLVDWLKQEMTTTELTVLRQATDDQMKLLEEETQRLKSELARAEQQRDEQQRLRQDYESQIAKLSTQSVADREAKLQAEAKLEQQARAITRLQQENSRAGLHSVEPPADTAKPQDEARKTQETVSAVRARDSEASQSASGGVLPGRIFTNTIGMTFVEIPAGDFVLGSFDGERDEKPAKARRITQPFYLQTTEVTIGQILVWLNAVGDCDETWILSSFSPRGCPIEARGTRFVMKDTRFVENTVRRQSEEHRQSEDHPMVMITLKGAKAFCQWLREKENRPYRLPWEAEWEYAAKAGSTGKWCFGDDEKLLGDYAWYNQNSGGTTHPVGIKEPNAFGVFDMHGNVLEWCEDRYNPSYYAEAPFNDPFNARGSGSGWVLRGGSCADSADYCRPANRTPCNSFSFGVQSDGPSIDRIGFRVAF